MRKTAPRAKMAHPVHSSRAHGPKVTGHVNHRPHAPRHQRMNHPVPPPPGAHPPPPPPPGHPPPPPPPHAAPHQCTCGKKKRAGTKKTAKKTASKRKIGYKTSEARAGHRYNKSVKHRRSESKAMRKGG